MYTTWAAHSIGLEEVVGSIEPGKAADFVVLSADPTAVAVTGIGRIEPTATWVNGKEVYNSHDA